MKKQQDKITLKEWKRQESGITLIALVVTIIVLIILAGVSVSMLTGQNGIITKAAEAKENTANASDLEYLQTKAYEALVYYYGNANTLSESEYVLDQLNTNGAAEGIIANKDTGKITYKGKTYDVSEVLGKTNEQKAIESSNLVQLPSTGDNVRMVLQEKDNEASQAVIPVGFYYVTGTPSTGLVISDVNGDDDKNTKGGNQFVWIPCNSAGIAYEKTSDDSQINDVAKYWDSKNSKEGTAWNTKQYYYDYDSSNSSSKYNDWRDKGGNATSVTQYGGFYVGRYEAGVPKGAPFYNDKDGSTYWQTYRANNSAGTNPYETGDYANTNKSKNDANYKPVSKKNTPSWNFISQQTAKTVSSKMYETSTSVTSSLIDSYAWDTITLWLNNDYSVTNSKDWGNYYDAEYKFTGLYARHYYNNGWFPAYKYHYGTYDKKSERTEIATGSSDRNIAKNIYDFAGNMWEWTTETGSHSATVATEESGEGSYAVLRGGGFFSYGAGYPACCRLGSHGSGYASHPYFGFRVVLYIK